MAKIAKMIHFEMIRCNSTSMVKLTTCYLLAPQWLTAHGGLHGKKNPPLPLFSPKIFFRLYYALNPSIFSRKKDVEYSYRLNFTATVTPQPKEYKPLRHKCKLVKRYLACFNTRHTTDDCTFKSHLKHTPN